MNTISNDQVLEMARKALGSDLVVPFEECITFEKEEIVDGVVFTESDLKDFNDELLGYTSNIEPTGFDWVNPNSDYIQAALVDPDNKVALFTIFEGDMEKVIKKELVRF